MDPKSVSRRPILQEKYLIKLIISENKRVESERLTYELLQAKEE